MLISKSILEPFGYTVISTISYDPDELVEEIYGMVRYMTHDLIGPPDLDLRVTLIQYAHEMGASHAGTLRTMSGYDFGFTIGILRPNFYSITIYTNKFDSHDSPGVV